MFSGSIVAIITPFKKEKDKLVFDEETFRKLINFHIKNGTSAIVPCGTTGESATLSYQEHCRIIEIAVEEARGKIPIIAGTGANSTEEAIFLTQHAEKVGCFASLQVAPYYNRPTQKGLYEHFKAISNAVKIPIILYNIPSRTGVNIEPETVAKLAKDCPNIRGIKEASGNLEQMARILLLSPKNFVLLSGDDALTLPVLSIGGKGVISVVANFLPKEVVNLINEFEKGNLKEAQAIYYKLLPLIKVMFIETNPIPVKTAMALLGMCEPYLRLPLCAMLEDNLEKLKKVLIDYGLKIKK